MSIIGTLSMSPAVGSANAPLTVAIFKDNAPSNSPTSWEPLSPRKMIAGLMLKTRMANSAPLTEKARIAGPTIPLQSPKIPRHKAMIT